MKQLYTLVFLLATHVLPPVMATTPPAMEAWQYPYKTHTISIPGNINVAYIDEGKGDNTLLFVHGLGSNLQAWQKNIEYLKKDYRCIAIDLPGYGKSSKGDYPFTVPFFAESVKSVIEQLKLKNVTLVGHSMGGQTVIQAALSYPKFIHRMVLIAPAGFEQFSEKEKGWLQTVFTADVVRAASEEQIKKNFNLNFNAMPQDAEFMIEDRLQMRNHEAEYTHYCNMIPQCVKGMLEAPVFDRLNKVETQTLVVYGKNDQLIPNKILHATLTTEQVAQDGHDQLPNSTLKLIDEGGHFVQWEQADAVNKAIVEFLSDK